MSAFTGWTARRGRDTPPPEAAALTAGPLSLLLEDGELKYVRLGGREVIRRIYAAVRDRNWGTVPGRISGLHVDARPDSFLVTYVSEHRAGGVDFVWRARIDGAKDGAIRFDFDGEARADFLRNRIGFCVLHPPDVAGGPCRCEHADGSIEDGAWPRTVAPSAPFLDIRALSHQVLPDLWARVAFEGEVFEMEDHRNWTDASFKTFSTPLARPYPVEVRRGERVRQTVTLRLEGNAGATAAPCAAAPVLTPVAGSATPLMRLGLGMASHGRSLEEREVALLRGVAPAHLRVDLHLSQPGWEAELDRASRDAAALGAELEAALFLSDDAAAEIRALAARPGREAPRVGAWIVLSERERATSRELAAAARKALLSWDPDARIGGGTNFEFVDVNRRRPPIDLLDFVAFSINPQVHAFDDDSLVESLAAQATVIESARAFTGGLPLAVTPVTLRRRVNPDATGPEPPCTPGELPPQVDPRQASLFGAAWTVASIKHLCEAGAASATYFETSGWRGVIDAAGGPHLPERFPSRPGAVFPVYHVLADVAELRGASVLPWRSSAPLAAAALCLTAGGRLRLLVASLRPHGTRIRVEGLRDRVRLRVLDEESFEEASVEPARFRSRGGRELRATGGVLELELAPYAVARIDADAR